MRTGPLAALLVGALLLAGCTGTDAPAADPSSQVAPAASDEPAFAPPAGVTTTVLDDAPVGLAAVGKDVWAALPDAGAVVAGDGRTVPVGDAPLRLVTTPAGVWVSVIRDGTLVRIDPATGDVDLRIRLKPAGSEPEGLAFDGTSLWAVDQAGNRLLRLDPASGKVLEELPTGAAPRLFALGDQGGWVANYDGASLTHVRLVHDCPGHDCLDYEAVDVPLHRKCLTPQGLAEVDLVVWVACTAQSRVLGVDAVSGEVVAHFEHVDHADALIAHGRDVYVVGQIGPTVWRIDPRTRTLGKPLRLDDAGPTTENVDAAVVANALVASHPEAHRLYDVPLRLLGR